MSDHTSPQLEDSVPCGSEASAKDHPSRNLKPRARGYGIGGGYEKPIRRQQLPTVEPTQSYGPLPHSGYYGAGSVAERFGQGQASFKTELAWYEPQYGERTSAPDRD